MSLESELLFNEHSSFSNQVGCKDLSFQAIELSHIEILLDRGEALAVRHFEIMAVNHTFFNFSEKL